MREDGGILVCVQQSYGLWEEAGCSAFKALSRVQQRKQSMVGVGGITPDVVSPGQVAFFVLGGRK